MFFGINALPKEVFFGWASGVKSQSHKEGNIRTNDISHVKFSKTYGYDAFSVLLIEGNGFCGVSAAIIIHS